MKTIPFLKGFEPVLRSGKKTTTFRSEKLVNVGEYFRAYSMDFLCTKVKRMTLQEVMDNHWQTEGVDSLDDFKEIWKKIHPRKGVDPTFVGYLITFKLVDNSVNRPEEKWF